MKFFRLFERFFLRRSCARCVFGLWVAISLCLTAAANEGCGSSAPGTIGAALGQKTDRRLFIRSLPAGEGAEQAGVLGDDEILSIDGKDVRAMTQEDVRRAVRGDVGSTMTLTILRTDPKTGSTEKKEVKV